MGALVDFVNEGWRFDVSDDGPEGDDGPDGRGVILLHGFPADRSCWTGISRVLNQAGYRTLAPDQRGYSPGARPGARRSYRMAALVSDVLALAEQAGVERFDVVGHDWGAAVAWNLAARHSARVRSVTALSVPHPAAMAYAARHLDQLRRSWYMAAFQVPVIPERVLGARRADPFRRRLERSGLGPTAAERYAQRARDAAMTGPLNWYRALPLDARAHVPAVAVPALFVWGDQDAFVSPRAAGACRAWMAGPARCETLAGVSHWLPEMAAGRTADLLQQHLENVENSEN